MKKVLFMTEISCCWLAFRWIATGNQAINISVTAVFTLHSVCTEFMLAGQTCTEFGNSYNIECLVWDVWMLFIWIHNWDLLKTIIIRGILRLLLIVSCMYCMQLKSCLEARFCSHRVWFEMIYIWVQFICSYSGV